MKTTLTGLLAFLCAATLAPAETVLFTGATIHPVSGPTIASGDVLVQDGRIHEVFDSSLPTRALFRSDAKRIDLKGLHLYPGLIALNTGLGLVEIEAVRATRDAAEVGQFTPDVRSWLAVNPDSELLGVARANGVAYFEPAPQGGVVAGQSGLVALDGWTAEQMAFKKPLALHVYWPSLGLNVSTGERGRRPERSKSLEEQDKDRREKLRELDDFFQEARAYTTARPATNVDTSFAVVPAWEAMLPVVRGEIPIMVHADEVRQIRAAVKWAETNHFKIILAEARDAWKVASLLASNQVPVVYNHIFTQPPTDSEAYDVQYAAPAVLTKAGVKVVMSLSSYRASLVKNLPYEAAQGVAFGWPAEEALKAITLYPAELAGVADRVGSIEPEKEATLVACDGDLLDIRTNVKRMWIAGKEVSLENRHTRLYEKYRNRPSVR